MSEEIKNLEGVLTFNGRPIMTPSRAKEVLEGMGLSEFTSERLCLLDEHFNELVTVTGVAALDYIFNADQLQAIAMWMQDPEGVTNA